MRVHTVPHSRQTHRHTYKRTNNNFHTHLIPAAAAAGVKKGEIGGTGLAVAVDAIGVGGVEPEPSRPDILFHTKKLLHGRREGQLPRPDSRSKSSNKIIGDWKYIMKLTINQGVK